VETGLTRNQILSELSKSPHGKLAEYEQLGRKAVVQDPDFFAHLIAWDRNKGDIRDAKVALPVISLTNPELPEELADNSLAHMAMLNPREFIRAYRFALEMHVHGRMRVRRLTEQYLRDLESDRHEWNRSVVQHRRVMKELYSLSHIKPSEDAQAILFKGHCPPSSIFEVIRHLKDMPPEVAASEIIARKIPFLIAQGALGLKMKNPDVVFALIQRMTPTELVTNTKNLEKWGLKTNPALRSAFEEGLKRASTSRSNVLKTTRAAEAMADSGLREKLRGLQDRQLDALGVEGNWLVLADKSDSMSSAIKLATEVAATLAKMVKGKVWLVFFNTSPQTIDVTGMSLDAIRVKTKHIKADGCTSIGCGLQRMLDCKLEIDGIAVVSDGGENRAPFFHNVYPAYAKFAGKEPPVYLYHCGHREPTFTGFMHRAGIDMQVFDVASNVDYYSLPNIVSTMRTNRYSLIDEVMETKLLTLEKVFKTAKRGEPVHA
jgi:hypothetical protein